MKTTPKNVMWEDGFYYLHNKSGASDELCRGMIRGVVTGLMSFGMTFEECMGLLKYYVKHHPESSEFRSLATILPECWIDIYLKA